MFGPIGYILPDEKAKVILDQKIADLFSLKVLNVDSVKKSEFF